MGSPLVPSLPTWKSSKSRPLALPNTPHLWIRYVNDTFVIQEAIHSQQPLEHINTQDPHIQSTVEEPDQEGSLPFLDTLVSPGPIKSLITSVYRKPTHTDQYLHWDSNHFIMAKHSVFNTLVHRAKVFSTNQQTLHKELEHIRKTLQACIFLQWALKSLQHKFNCKHNIHNGQNSTDNESNNNNNEQTTTTKTTTTTKRTSP